MLSSSLVVHGGHRGVDDPPEKDSTIRRSANVFPAVLLDLGLHSIRLLTNNPKKIVGLDGYDIEITGREPLTVEPGAHNERYLATKRTKLGHIL